MLSVQRVRVRPPSSWSRRAWLAGLALYRDRALEDLNLSAGLGKVLLELVVLGFKLLKLSSVWRLHNYKAETLHVNGRLTKAAKAAKFFDGYALVSLLEEADDLLIGKTALFHNRYSPKSADFVLLHWYGGQGAGHFGNLSPGVLSLVQSHEHCMCTI